MCVILLLNHIFYSVLYLPHLKEVHVPGVLGVREHEQSSVTQPVVRYVGEPRPADLCGHDPLPNRVTAGAGRVPPLGLAGSPEAKGGEVAALWSLIFLPRRPSRVSRLLPLVGARPPEQMVTPLRFQHGFQAGHQTGVECRQSRLVLILQWNENCTIGYSIYYRYY